MPGTSDGRGTLRFMRRGKVGDALERVADYVWCNDSNPTMVHTTPNDKKDPGSIESQNKPAAITVNHPGRGAVTYDATHFITNSEVVSIYLGARSDGIDIQTHITRCVIDRTVNHNDADAGTGAGSDTEDDEERRTGGHAYDDEWLHEEDMMIALSDVSVGDTIDVTAYREQGLGSVTFSRNVIDVEDREILFDDACIRVRMVPPELIDDDGDRIGPVNAVKVSRDVSDDCILDGEVEVEIPEDLISEDEPRLVTDCGRPRTVIVHCDYCTGGMSVKPETDKPETGWKCKQCWREEMKGANHRKTLDIIDDVVVEPGDRVEYDGREWVFVDYCMDHHTTLVPVGIVASAETVRRPVDVRDLEPVETGDDDPYREYTPEQDGRDGRSLVADDGERSDLDPELVTDGGHSITPGDVVTYGDERWRVSRIGRAHVEIYQLGEGSTAVDIDEVAVNEVIA